MQKLLSRAALIASAGALALSPTAMASGGKLLGGGATGGGGGGSTTTTTSGGGGGGGGGTNTGGVNDPSPAVPCATLSNLAAPVGYYSIYAALWNDVTIQSCSSGDETVQLHVTNTNHDTGTVDYDVTTTYFLKKGSNAGVVIDNDFAPFNTNYDVRFDVSDASTGAPLATASTTATTPPQK
jgi:hypothetical protein